MCLKHISSIHVVFGKVDMDTALHIMSDFILGFWCVLTVYIIAYNMCHLSRFKVKTTLCKYILSRKFIFMEHLKLEKKIYFRWFFKYFFLASTRKEMSLKNTKILRHEERCIYIYLIYLSSK